MSAKKKFSSAIIILSALLLGHFTVDWFSGILKPILPLIMNRFSLTAGQTALIPSALGIATSFLQPFGAYLGEIFSEKLMVILSILITLIFVPLIGISKSLLIFIIFISIGLIGNSFFHPNAASLVGQLKFKKPHTAMSVFSIGGTIGSGVAPIMILLFIDKFGFSRLPLLTLFGLVVAGIILFALLMDRKGMKKQKIKKPSMISALKSEGTKELLAVNVLRSLVIMGFSTLIPLYIVFLKLPIIWVGYFLSASRFTGAFGTYTGAVLSDKFGPKFVNILSLALGTLFGVFVFVTRNVYIMFAAFSVAFFFWFFTMGANVTYMQLLLPDKRAIASSLGMGISWGTASILLTILSLFIDKIGLVPVFIFVFLASPVALLLSLKLVDA